MLAGLASAPVHAQTVLAPPAAQAAETVILRPGDMIHIKVWRKPELSGEFAVAPGGAIGDPFYADVIVGGLSVDQARERIRNHIARIEVDPMVWVEPILRVVVMGEVRQPNLYPVRYPTTLGQAIAQAGGPTEAARLDRVQFVRGGIPQVIDLRNPASPHTRIVLLSGDEIIVPRRSTRFRDSLVPISTLASVAGLIVTLSTR